MSRSKKPQLVISANRNIAHALVPQNRNNNCLFLGLPNHCVQFCPASITSIASLAWPDLFSSRALLPFSAHAFIIFNNNILCEKRSGRVWLCETCLIVTSVGIYSTYWISIQGFALSNYVTSVITLSALHVSNGLATMQWNCASFFSFTLYI